MVSGQADVMEMQMEIWLGFAMAVELDRLKDSYWVEWLVKIVVVQLVELLVKKKG